MTRTRQAFAQADAADFLQALPDPVLLIGPDGDAELNAAAQALLGPPGHASTWTALFPPAAAPQLHSAVDAASRGEPSQLHLSLPSRTLPALVTVTPAGAGGALLHLRLPEETPEVAQSLLDDMGLGVVVQDRETRILDANAAALEILGLSLDELTGRTSVDPRWQTLTAEGEPFRPEDRPVMRALQTGEAQRDVLYRVFNPRRGDWRWLNVTALPRWTAGQAQPDQVLSVLRDVTERHRLLQRLQDSEARFRTLVQATSQMVWTAAPDGEFRALQPNWQAFTGQTEQEYLRQGWLDAIHPEDRAGTLAAWTAAVAQAGMYTTLHRIRRADGAYVPMQARAVPVCHADGSVREWIGTHTDVSAVQAAEAQLRASNASLEQRVADRTREMAEATRFSSLLLNAAGEGIFGLTLQGRAAFANPAAARSLGYGVERLIGADLHDLIHHHHESGEPHPKHECPIYLTLRDGETRRVEADTFWHADGRAIPVSYVVTPTRDHAGQITGAVTMFRDVTERRRAEEQLEHTLRELRRSNQDLSRFASIASHDLQEPLRTIGNYADLLSRRYQGQLDDRADRYLAFLREAVTRMQSLIQDLLHFSRLGRDDQPHEPVALDTLMHQVQSNVRASLESTGGQLTWETPHAVLGRPSLLLQLLTNLISNALKFHQEGQPPVVTVRSEGNRRTVHVTVRDNGIGISSEYHERIFDIFQRLHGRAEYEGNGIGLAIGRKIAEYHGGTLRVESSSGQGSTFHLTLPAAPESPAPTPRETA